jgi:hypothetical protein
MVAGAVILCPYCGHVQGGATDVCQSCSGRLTILDRRATQTGMGPWSIRDQSQPFFPGFEYDVLKKKLTSAKIGPTTLLRGPTTHQFWVPARQVPGVAHLKGLCHNCGSSADRNANSCAKCSCPYPAPGQRNELGLPWAAPAAVMHQFRAKNPTICPVCGENTPARDSCSACKTVFEPADAATALSLGPWYIRDTRAPFRPGHSHEYLSQLIDEGRLQETTVIRGPTSQQFWMMAKSVQGVSQLLGFCHKCGAAATAQQKQCNQCQSDFSAPTDPNILGLMYPTADIANEARKTLDLLRMQSQAPVQEIDHGVQLVPVDAVDAEDAQALMDEQPEDDYHADEGYYDDYYDDEPADFDNAEASAWEGPDVALAAASVSPAPSKLSAEAVAEAKEAAASQKEMEKMIQMLLLAVPLVVLVIVGLFFLAGRGGTTPKNGPPKPPKVAKNDPGIVDTKAYAEIKKLQAEAKAKYELIKDVDPADDFGVRIKKSSTRLSSAKRLAGLKKFADAKTILVSVSSEMDAIKSEAAARVSARNNKDLAQKARKSAKDANADELAAQTFADAEDDYLTGQDNFEDGKYAVSAAAYKKAADAFNTAAGGVLIITNANKAADAYKKRLTANYSANQLKLASPDGFKKVEQLAKDAEAAMISANYTQATAKFKQATTLVPQMEDALRKTLGVKYWAYYVGRISTEIMFQKAGEKAATPEQMGALEKGYKEMGLPAALFKKVPTGPDADYDTLKSVILDEAQIEIEAAIGIEASEAFGLAKDFKTVEVILDRLESNSKLSPLVVKQVDKIKISAQAAGFSPKFMLFLSKFQTSAKNLPNEGAINACKVMWSNMTGKLNVFETSVELVNTLK